jgi:TonB family protein
MKRNLTVNALVRYIVLMMSSRFVSGLLVVGLLISLPICSQEKNTGNSGEPNARQEAPKEPSQPLYQAGKNGVGYPSCLHCPNPKRTKEAKKAKYQGSVLLQAVIEPDGRASHVQIVRGVGLGLDETAIDAVQHWRFKPALDSNRTPVPVTMPVEVTFTLNN